jgi:hypothetical protein
MVLNKGRRTGCARDCSGNTAAKRVPMHPFCEELERKARFPVRSAGNAPKTGRTVFLCVYPLRPLDERAKKMEFYSNDIDGDE